MASRNAKGRMIYWKISYCKQLSRCSILAQLLFTWLVPNADDLGRMEGDPEIIKGMIFPYHLKITMSDIEKALKELLNEKLIYWYKIKENWYLSFPNFEEYQKLRQDRTYKSDYPPPTEIDMTSHDMSDKIWEKRSEVKGSEGEEKEKGSEGEERIPIPYEDIKNLFNSICISLSSIKTLTNSRKEKIKIRWSEIKNIEMFKELFIKVETIPFCKGVNDRKWKANFDWLMENDRNYLKVLEGNYDNKDKYADW